MIFQWYCIQQSDFCSNHNIFNSAVHLTVVFGSILCDLLLLLNLVTRTAMFPAVIPYCARAYVLFYAWDTALVWDVL